MTAREQCLAMLVRRHPAAAWWDRQSVDVRRVLVSMTDGVGYSAVASDWGNLNETEAAALAVTYARLSRQYLKLRAMFDHRGAAGVA